MKSPQWLILHAHQEVEICQCWHEAVVWDGFLFSLELPLVGFRITICYLNMRKSPLRVCRMKCHGRYSGRKQKTQVLWCCELCSNSKEKEQDFIY